MKTRKNIIENEQAQKIAMVGGASKQDGLTVLSLFDGMSCGQIALREAGIKVSNYFASEIDKHAIAQTQHNFPETVQLGDVRGVRAADLPPIDLLIGGSPCQGFSFAGKQLNFDDPRSVLFFEYVRILKEIRVCNPDVLFLLENVRMKKACENVISQQLGLFPVVINSALVSAQNRVRLYWTNIRTKEERGIFETLVYTDIPQPADRGIFLSDILEPEEDVSPSFVLTNHRIKKLIEHQRRQVENGNGFGFRPRRADEKSNTMRIGGAHHDDLVILQRPRGENKGGVFRRKTPTLTANAWERNNLLCVSSTQAHATVSLNKSTPLVAAAGMGGGHVPMITRVNDRTRKVIQLNPSTESGGKQPFQQNRVYSTDGVTPALCSERAGFAPAILTDENIIRRLTPKESARLQTIPDWYDWKCSDTQKYKMLGNGWTVEVIKHIFSFIKPKDRC